MPSIIVQFVCAHFRSFGFFTVGSASWTWPVPRLGPGRNRRIRGREAGAGGSGSGLDNSGPSPAATALLSVRGTGSGPGPDTGTDPAMATTSIPMSHMLINYSTKTEDKIFCCQYAISSIKDKKSRKSQGRFVHVARNVGGRLSVPKGL
jgi:hypothetical protein